MANTYTLIASNTLSSSAASVTFSSIPATYTDLVVKASTRNDGAVVRNAFFILPNSETTSSTLGSDTTLYGVAATAGSGRHSNTYPWRNLFDENGASATSNTFANWECYIPSYTASQNKPLSNFGVSENNTANDPLIGVVAALYRSTSAITSLTITSGYNFVSGSSFFLYGIKNT